MKLWEAEIPGIKEWPPESLLEEDHEWAFKKLFGKSSEAALNQLKFNSSAYTENLGVMPPSAFRFYFKVLVEYLLSDGSKDDPGAASGMFYLIRYDIQSGQNKSFELTPYLPLILRKVAERQEFYGADIDIFGDFKTRAEEIIHLIESRNS
jgi:hypothetical protein